MSESLLYSDSTPIPRHILASLLTTTFHRSLIRKHARTMAAKPAMWGGRNPTAANVEKLATACQTEWTRALEQMLRQWATPPSTSGR